MFPRSDPNRTVVSQVPKIWQGRTEPEPRFENTLLSLKFVCHNFQLI